MKTLKVGMLGCGVVGSQIARLLVENKSDLTSRAGANLELVKVLPMKFDSFYVSLLSEKYKTGKMNFIKAFFIGIKSNWKGSQKMEYSSHIYVLKNLNN